MRKTWIVRSLICGAALVAVLALGTAPEAQAAPFGVRANPVLADIYVGFGFGGCGYHRPYYGYPYYAHHHYAPYYYRPYAYRPYYGGYYRGYPRYRGYYRGYYPRYRGYYGGTRRVIGRRR